MSIGFIVPQPNWGPAHSANPDFTPFEDEEYDDE